MATIPQYLTIDQMMRDTPPNRPDVALMFNRFSQSPFLTSRRFENLPGRAGAERQEVSDLPATGRRGLNEDFTATGGRSSIAYDPMKIYGLKLQHDKAGLRMGLVDPVKQTEMAARSIRLTLEADAITGDPTSTPKGVRGLQYFAENSGDTTRTSISAGTTSGGAALSKYLFDNAIDECVEPVAIVLSMKMRNRFTGASRDKVLSGAIDFSEDSFGRKIGQYQGLPLIPMERSVANARLLGFTEAASTGASTATSIYVIGAGYEWFQNGPPQLDDLAVTGSQQPREMTWILGCSASRYSVVRIKHIGDLAIVA